MEREHCASSDSDITFTTGNYGITTTSRIEWLFVSDPGEGLKKTGRDQWPLETKNIVRKRQSKGFNAFKEDMNRINGLHSL
jgi:hypothetical protein